MQANTDAPACRFAEENIRGRYSNQGVTPDMYPTFNSLPNRCSGLEPWAISAEASAGKSTHGCSECADSGGCAAVSVSPKCHASPGVTSRPNVDQHAEDMQHQPRGSLPTSPTHYKNWRCIFELNDARWPINIFSSASIFINFSTPLMGVLQCKQMSSVMFHQ